MRGVTHDYTRRLCENVIEIAWMFDDLQATGEIIPWEVIADTPTQSDGVREEIIRLAEDFEKTHPTEYWETSDCVWLETITEYAADELVKVYGKEVWENTYGN